MKHAILTRINFDDKALMEKYLKITEKYFISSLKSQTDQNFTLVNICRENDVEYLKNRLNYDFVDVRNAKDFFEYCKENNYNVQTRHDCDDWMAPEYIELIHDNYTKNIDLHDKFLIQSQPLKVMHPSGKTYGLKKYHSKRCSMHLTLCQRKVKNHIYERQHAHMYEIANKVINLPGNPTKWIIHGNNISVKKGSVRYDGHK